MDAFCDDEIFKRLKREPPIFRPAKVYGPPRRRPVYGPPRQIYGPSRPVYGPPLKPKYGPPSINYGTPFNYAAPASNYGAPSSNYGAPSSGYGAPSPSYGAPPPSYGSPSPSYGAPSFAYGAPGIAPAPVPTYNAPPVAYKPPSANYGVPSSNYGAPSSNYGPPASSYSAPAPFFGPPSGSYASPSSYGVPTSNYPPRIFNTISSNYGAPPQPSFNYGAPQQPNYVAPSYGPPPQQSQTYGSPYSQPTHGYESVSSSYATPSFGYQASSPTYEAPVNYNNHPLTYDSSTASYDTPGALTSYGTPASHHEPSNYRVQPELYNPYKRTNPTDYIDDSFAEFDTQREMYMSPSLSANKIRDGPSKMKGKEQLNIKSNIKSDNQKYVDEIDKYLTKPHEGNRPANHNYDGPGVDGEFPLPTFTNSKKSTIKSKKQIEPEKYAGDSLLQYYSLHSNIPKYTTVNFKSSSKTSIQKSNT